MKLILQAIKAMFRRVDYEIEKTEKSTIRLGEKTSAAHATANEALAAAAQAQEIANKALVVDDLVFELVDTPILSEMTSANVRIASGTFSAVYNALNNGMMPRVLLHGRYKAGGGTYAYPLAAQCLAVAADRPGSSNSLDFMFLIHDAGGYTPSYLCRINLQESYTGGPVYISCHIGTAQTT